MSARPDELTTTCGRGTGGSKVIEKKLLELLSDSCTLGIVIGYVIGAFVIALLGSWTFRYLFSIRRGRPSGPPGRTAVAHEAEILVLKGKDKTYILQKVEIGDLAARVRAGSAELAGVRGLAACVAGGRAEPPGVRDVVAQEGLERVFDVLRAPYTEEPTNWSRRYKANLEKLASGDVNKVAEVVRDLWRRDRERGLSAGEKRMLAKARQILVSELALAEKTNEDKAEALLDEILAS